MLDGTGRMAERGKRSFQHAGRARSAGVLRSVGERRGVLLARGALFDYPGDRYFRLGFARRNLSLALAEMEAALPEWS